MSGTAERFHIGVDIGGTFTDCVAIDGDGHVSHAKALSTHATSATEGVIEGLEQLAADTGRTLDELLAACDRLGHGTTIGTNLVVERKGARVGVVATAGHGDALHMMRGAGRTAGVPIDQVYSVHATSKPAPLVPRSRVFEVHERVDATGAVLAPLDRDRARETLRALLETHEVDAVAVSLLWSFRNPEHERAIAELLADLDPSLHVSLSHEVSPRQGEYERTVATAINAYVGPASSDYLETFHDELEQRGLGVEPLVLQANGGVAPLAVAKALPVTTIGSGPAGGLAGTADLAASADRPNVIATDMGGTSFDVGLITGGEPIVASEQVIDHYTFVMPHLDVRSIACGGGSIARIDEHSGTIRVGPESAGSDPGPACYGRGGEEPTVTDADLVLGLIRAEAFLSGRMPLDEEAARTAVGGLARRLGLEPEEAAAGIVRINNHSAATLIRQRTVEKGLDPRDFTVYAFGGAGPVHAFGYAAELGAREVVVPLGNGASTLSAYGIAASDTTRYFEREVRLRAPFDASELQDHLAALNAQARDALSADGELALEATALMRYAEQFLNELQISLPEGEIDDDASARVQEEFTSEYGRVYGAGAAIFQNAEIFALRLRARIPTDRQAGAVNGSSGGAEPSGERRVFWPSTMSWVDTAVYEGGAFAPGSSIEGAALVELPHTAVGVAPGQLLRADEIGNLVLTLEER